MIIYKDDNDIRLVQSVASASTLISSMTGEIREYILSKFPKNYFREIYIDTAETIHAQARNDKHNRNLNKIPYPNLAITPEITIDSPVEGMEKSPVYNSPNLFVRKDMKNYYKRILLDPEEKYSIYYTSEYVTANFNFKITTNKFIQNTDIVYYIKSKFQQGFFQFLNDRYLHTEVPKTFVKLISYMKGWDLNDPDDMTEMQLYMIGTSTTNKTFQKKVNMGTGKIGFFLNDRVNFLTLINDIDAPSSISREMMSEGEYTISFRVQVSAWLPNSFIMSIDGDKFLELDRSLIEDSLENSTTEQDEGFFSIAVSEVLMNRKDSRYFELSSGEPEVFQEIQHMVFTYDTAIYAGGIDLTDYMKDDLKRVHAYMIARNLEVSDLIRVTLHNRNGQIPDEDVLTDYNDLLTIIKLSSAQDISLSMYVNRVYFEALQKAMSRDEFFFNKNALATIKIKINDELLRVPVYSFKNERDFYSSEWNKLLRINTIYGIGYIGLERDDDPEKSAYKICVGYKDNEPSIYRLQTL